MWQSPMLETAEAEYVEEIGYRGIEKRRRLGMPSFLVFVFL